MNEYAAYPQPVPGGFRVMMRFARDSQPKPIMGEGEKPLIYPTETAAWKACAHHLLRYLNFPIVAGEGGTLNIKEANRQKAEKIFTKGRVIEVEKMGERA